LNGREVSDSQPPTIYAFEPAITAAEVSYKLGNVPSPKVVWNDSIYFVNRICFRRVIKLIKDKTYFYKKNGSRCGGFVQ